MIIELFVLSFVVALISFCLGRWYEIWKRHRQETKMLDVMADCYMSLRRLTKETNAAFRQRMLDRIKYPCGDTIPTWLEKDNDNGNTLR